MTRRQSLSALVAAADADRDPDRPLASALRVMALREFRLLSGLAPAGGQATVPGHDPGERDPGERDPGERDPGERDPGAPDPGNVLPPMGTTDMIGMGEPGGTGGSAPGIGAESVGSSTVKGG